MTSSISARSNSFLSPDGGEIGSKCKQAIALVLGEHAWTCAFAACKFGFGGFECAQALFPFALKATGDQPVIWIDGTITSLRTASFVACPLNTETPLLERGLAISFKPFSSGKSSAELCRFKGRNESPRDGFVDLDASNVEAIDAAALDQDLAWAMISWC
jgi:hypothetical protein